MSFRRRERGKGTRFINRPTLRVIAVLNSCVCSKALAIGLWFYLFHVCSFFDVLVVDFGARGAENCLEYILFVSVFRRWGGVIAPESSGGRLALALADFIRFVVALMVSQTAVKANDFVC